MTQIPWGELGLITYTRTYSRAKDDGTKEVFPETVERIVDGCNTQLGMNLSEEKKQDLRDIMLNMKGMVAGRFLWQLGTDTVGKLGLASLQNCAATVVDHPIRPFTWAMDMLMLGSGVGYNIQREHVYEIPKVVKGPSHRALRMDSNDADYIVPDSREGWVKLLGKVLKAYFYSGESFTYSTRCIRGKGASIKGFGGTASGPEELCRGLDWICNLLDKRIGKKVRPIDCLDIMNILGYVVVAGNVRRSAQLAIGDYDDIQYLSAKRWDLGPIPNWRAMSNNSVACKDTNDLPSEFWAGYEGKGEPYGLINLNLSRQVGRLGETEYPDPDVMAYNPCAEQSLNNFETCCLAEVFLPNILDKAELIKTVKALYEVCKHSLALPCHHPETEAIVNSNMRMGIGVTGYLQATEEQRTWLSEVYKELREYDVSYSAIHNFPVSTKLTTVKPSGTLSLLAGVTSGCHPGYSEYFIRRIRIATSSPLVGLCRNKGYKVEPVKGFDGSDDPNTMVVEFPCSYPSGTKFARDMTAIEQMEVVKRLQTEWSDNSVSCTVYYRKEELDEIKSWLSENYSTSTKTISFLLHSEHGFAQAPFEEITKEEYETIKSQVEPLDSVSIDEADLDLEECVGGACPIK
jgi:adenosylcobalamin-dependent ribonucleoside-triphosphate reductase